MTLIQRVFCLHTGIRGKKKKKAIEKADLSRIFVWGITKA